MNRRNFLKYLGFGVATVILPIPKLIDFKTSTVKSETTPGWMYYNTSTKKLMQFNGTEWKEYNS